MNYLTWWFVKFILRQRGALVVFGPYFSFVASFFFLGWWIRSFSYGVLYRSVFWMTIRHERREHTLMANFRVLPGRTEPTVFLWNADMQWSILKEKLQMLPIPTSL